MRIRRYASKLLGLGIVNPVSSPQPRPWPAPELRSTAGESSGESLICDLNKSPWDDMTPDLYLRDPHEARQKAAAEDQEKDPISEASYVKEIKGKEEEEEVKEEEIRYCKRRDGKGWHCKRPARPHSTLCDYHIHQFQTYYTRKKGVKLIANQQKKKHEKEKKRKQKKKIGKVVDGGLEYYYYSGFGPWRGKNRAERSDSSVINLEEQQQQQEAQKEKNTDGYRKRKGSSVKCRSLKSLI